MKKNDYVYVLQCEGCLSTESFWDLESIFATEEGAEQALKNAASNTIANIDQYVDFENGYGVYEDDAYWEVRSDKWSDLYVRFFYDKVLVQ